MAAAAVRYLRSTGAPTAAAPTAASTVTAPVEALPRPALRAVGENERRPVAPAEFRRVLGNFATGVTVVTAPPAEGEQTPAGFACQSFAALSLDPPLVVLMVGRTSRTWPLIARAGVFCVNVLGAGQGELCRGFAVSGADKFAGVEYDAAPASGSPRLAGTAAWIDCTIQAVHTGGDHLIVVGRVDELGTGEDGGSSAPLLFHRGRFTRPEGDRPERDQPEGDRPERDQPEGDRPEGDRPEGDRPERDQPEGDQVALRRPSASTGT